MLERLYSELAANTALNTALDGELCEGSRPQGAPYPSLNFKNISDVDASASHSGPGTLHWHRITFEAWALTPKAARDVIVLLKVALGTIDLTAAVESPATVVTKNRHQYLFQMSDEWKDPEPIVYRELLDVKIWAREE